MALDGLVVSALVHEFNNTLSFNKIEKIYQPEVDEIVMHLRCQGKNLKLLLSVNSNYPRVHFTNVNKENPSTPPNFCMLLRKYLQGSKIVSITQPNFDRIIQFRFETFDELNMIKSIDLIIEMMGRHSNIILVDCKSNKILDSIKRISLDVSRYRQVLPGLKYDTPPSQNKLNPLDITNLEEFHTALTRNSQDPIQRNIVNTFVGISPLISRELCYRSKIEENTLLNNLSQDNLEQLYNCFSSLIFKIKTNDFEPCFFINEKNNKYIDFSGINIEHLSLYKKTKTSSISSMLESFYIQRDQRERIQQKSHGLRKSISTKLDRLYNKVQNLHQDLKKAQKLDTYKLKGDLLTSNLYLIQKGDDKIEVINYYDENSSTITIALDKRLSPSQNAQSYYKKYNKSKNALLEVNHQLKKAKSEINYLEQIIISIDHSTYLSDLEEIHNELIETGYLKKRLNKKNITHFKQSGYLKYKSSDGFEILVGKNNKQNDEITLKIAGKEDLWFHIKDMPGSHVILKTGGQTPPEGSLLEAANLAAYYSKAKGSPKIAVDYTLRKNIRKPKGAKPGMVIYEDYTTILANGEEIAIANIEQIS